LIIVHFYAAWDKEDTSGKRGMDFNSQDLQRFKCSLLLTGDKKLRNCDQEFLHFVPVLVGYGTFYSCSFFYGYFQTFEHCWREGDEWLS
jgi:hypothetical protein